MKIHAPVLPFCSNRALWQLTSWRRQAAGFRKKGCLFCKTVVLLRGKNGLCCAGPLCAMDRIHVGKPHASLRAERLACRPANLLQGAVRICLGWRATAHKSFRLAPALSRQNWKRLQMFVSVLPGKTFERAVRNRFQQGECFLPERFDGRRLGRSFHKSQDHFKGLGFTDGRNTQGARERFCDHSNSNRGRRLCGDHGRGFFPGRITALQILRPESAGFPQNLEGAVAGELVSPSASLSKRRFGQVKKPRPFQRSWLCNSRDGYHAARKEPAYRVSNTSFTSSH